MANDVGNLAAKLTLNASGFTAGITAAEKEAASLSASLQKQIDTMSVVGRSADVYRLSLQGVSRETIQRIESQQAQIAALNETAAAEKKAADAAEKAANDIANAKRLAAKAADAAQAASQRQAAIDVKALESRALAVQQQEQAKLNALMQRARQITEATLSVDERRANLVNELGMLLRKGAISQQAYNQQLKAYNDAANQAKAASMSASGGIGNASFAIQQLAFGAQDAATVFGTQGLAGAVRASSNNVIQFASLINPMYGTLAAVIGVGVALWADYNQRQQAATKSTEKMQEALQKLRGIFDELGQSADEYRRHLDEMANLRKLNSTEAIKDRFEQFDRELQGLNVELDDKLQYREKLLAGIARQEGLAAGNPFFRGTQEEYDQAADKLKEYQKLLEDVNKDLGKVNDRRNQVFSNMDKLEAKFGDVQVKESNDQLRQIQEHQSQLAKKAADDAAKEQERTTAKAEQDAKSLASLQNSLTSDIKTPEKQIENVMAKLEERQKKINELATDPKQAASINLEAIDAATRELERVKDEQNQSLQFAGAAEFGSTEAFSRSLQTENRSVSENTKQLVDLAKEQLKEARKKKEVELQEASF